MIIPPIPHVDRIQQQLGHYDHSHIIDNLKTDATLFLAGLCAHDGLRQSEDVIAFVLLSQGEWERHWRKITPILAGIWPAISSLVRTDITFGAASDGVKDLLLNELTTTSASGQLCFEGSPQVDLERCCTFIVAVNGSLQIMLKRTSELISNESLTQVFSCDPWTTLVVKLFPNCSLGLGLIEQASSQSKLLTSLSGQPTSSPSDTTLLSALSSVLTESQHLKGGDQSMEATERFFHVRREVGIERHQALLELFYDIARAHRWCDAALDVFRQGTMVLEAIVGSTRAHEKAKASVETRAAHELELHKAERKLATQDSVEGAIEAIALIGRTYFHGCAAHLHSTEERCASKQRKRGAEREKYSTWQHCALSNIAPFCEDLSLTIGRIALRWLEFEKAHAFERAGKFERLVADLDRSVRGPMPSAPDGQEALPLASISKVLVEEEEHADDQAKENDAEPNSGGRATGDTASETGKAEMNSEAGKGMEAEKAAAAAGKAAALPVEATS